MSSIIQKRDDVIKRLSYFESWEDRFKQILSYGKKLDPMDEALKNNENQVKGCLSKVWLSYDFKDGKVYFKADSDAAITKGIIALLVNVYSGETPEQIIALKPDFLKDVGITEHLSMNRRNGLANMCQLIDRYAKNCQEKTN